jgi:methionyl-tRNA formyltransferase
LTRSALRLVFAGTPDFSVPALEALHAAGHTIAAVYTQPDRPAGRGRALAAGPVKRRATELGLVVEQPATLKTAEAQLRLASYAPDLMVVVAYGLILPPPLLAIPTHGCLNIHASLLPRWRGAAPIQRALLAGDPRTGVCIMLMDAGLDTGPELLRYEVEIGPHETGGQLHDRLAALGATAIVEAVPSWVEGRLEARPQPETGATYASKLRKEEAPIDWSQPAVAIERQVRAFNPWPVAEATVDGEQVRVWDARALPVERGDGPRAPGQVVHAAAGRLVVATGAGDLELLTLQFPGRRPLPVREILHARAFGDARFGGVSA